ncbi:MAG: hypothetical protein Q9227_001258 [Pyrenula ochraceoflavens]
MAPALRSVLLQKRTTDDESGHDKAALSLSGDILEAWGEGYMVGSLIILMLIVVCNYRRRVMLHKLILFEMLLALLHGTFIFLEDPTYGWYLSATALLLFISYQIHNVVSFLKIRPFLPRWGRWVFLITLLCVQPFWIVEAWDNFEYFNHNNDLNVHTRPWEALARDPWWIFTTCFLLYKIKVQYEFTAVTLLSTSMRFVVMIVCMILSIAFLLADVIVTAASLMPDAGINPYWRLTLVFKCAADTIFLDDFKSVLDSIVAKRFREFRFTSEGRRNAYSGFDSNGTTIPPLSPTTQVPKTGTSLDADDIRQVSTTSDRRSMSRGRPLTTNRGWLSSLFHDKNSSSKARPVERSPNNDGYFRTSGDDNSGIAMLPKPDPAVPRIGFSMNDEQRPFDRSSRWERVFVSPRNNQGSL